VLVGNSKKLIDDLVREYQRNEPWRAVEFCFPRRLAVTEWHGLAL
jgi:hypothetical protein